MPPVYLRVKVHPSKVAGPSPVEQECSICLEPCTNVQIKEMEVCFQPCFHRFHEACWNEWEAHHKDKTTPVLCPVCKKDPVKIRREQEGMYYGDHLPVIIPMPGASGEVDKYFILDPDLQSSGSVPGRAGFHINDSFAD